MLAGKFEKQFICLGENTEKNNLFSSNTKRSYIFFRLEFIDSGRFIVSSLSNLVNNLVEGIDKIKFKYKHDDKKCENCGIKYKYCDCFFKYTNIEDALIECKYLCCNKDYQKKFYVKEGFFNTYKYSNHMNNNHIYSNKFVLLLRKSVCPYEDRNDWKKFN